MKNPEENASGFFVVTSPQTSDNFMFDSKPTVKTSLDHYNYDPFRYFCSILSMF